MSENKSFLSRRRVLTAALQAAGLLGLTGCEGFFNRLQQSQKVLSVLESVEGVNRRLLRFLAGRNALAQEFAEKDISRYFKPNGNPPPMTLEYLAGAANNWADWKLEIAGLVERKEGLGLPAIKAMPARTQITRHDCVEGWSAIAKWKGVALGEIIQRVRPQAEVKYVVFHCWDTDSEGNAYYESIDLRDALHPQTILAYEMNDKPLPVAHGAPLRLRVETQLGYKMAKYIQRVEFVASVAQIGQGKGGYWADQGYEWYAGI